MVTNPPAGFPGEGHSNAFQYSCLENPMDRGAWWGTVHRVAKSLTQLKWLNTHTHTHTHTHREGNRRKRRRVPGRGTFKLKSWKMSVFSKLTFLIYPLFFWSSIFVQFTSFRNIHFYPYFPSIKVYPDFKTQIKSHFLWGSLSWQSVALSPYYVVITHFNILFTDIWQALVASLSSGTLLRLGLGSAGVSVYPVYRWHL